MTQAEAFEIVQQVRLQNEIDDLNRAAEKDIEAIKLLTRHRITQLMEAYATPDAAAARARDCHRTLSE